MGIIIPSIRQPQNLQQLRQIVLIHLLVIQTHGQGNILRHIQHRDQIVGLEYESHIPAPVCGKLCIRLTGKALSPNDDLTGGGRIQRPQQVQQSGFTASAFPHQRNKFSRLNLHGHIVHRPDSGFSPSIHLYKIFGFYNVCMIHQNPLLSYSLARQSYDKVTKIEMAEKMPAFAGADYTSETAFRIMVWGGTWVGQAKDSCIMA